MGRGGGVYLVRLLKFKLMFTLFFHPMYLIGILFFLFLPAPQLESCGFEDICKSEYGMDAGKFSFCRNSCGR